MKSNSALGVIIAVLCACLNLQAFEVYKFCGPVTYNLSRDFSATNSPARVWSYGATMTLGGEFALFTYHYSVIEASGSLTEGWQLVPHLEPTIHRNSSNITNYSDGGQAVYPPGTVTLFSGTDGVPYPYGVARFTVPHNGAGRYLVKTSVESYISGPLSGDTDFHVLKNGVELFGRWLPGNSQTAFSATLRLKKGDTIDFVVGRGADGSGSYSGLKITASLAKK
jgi:hypothetical protein